MPVLIKLENGDLDVVSDADEIVSPAWSESLAAVMRSLGERFLVFPADFQRHVTLRKLAVAAGGEGVNPAHVAIAMYLMLQDGEPVDEILETDLCSLRESAKALDL
jgi:hypothetical protein